MTIVGMVVHILILCVVCIWLYFTKTAAEARGITDLKASNIDTISTYAPYMGKAKT